MANFKIKSITDTLPKRNPNCNITLDLTYVENMNKKTVSIRPGQEVIMVLGSLPQNIAQLRMKKMIVVEEINIVQVNKLLAQQNKAKIENRVQEIPNKSKKQ